MKGGGLYFLSQIPLGGIGRSDFYGLLTQQVPLPRLRLRRKLLPEGCEGPHQDRREERLQDGVVFASAEWLGAPMPRQS